MKEQELQGQIDALNQKMDLLLEYVQEQRSKSEAIDDLVADLGIIGKDAYDTTVENLNNQAIELDPDELAKLGMLFLRNVPNFITMMNTMESTIDLIRETGPIVNEIIIDVSKKLGEFEDKGYFEFLRETGGIVDNIITGFSPEDVRALADNIVIILDTLKRLTQPEMMKSIDNAVTIYSSLEMENVPEYSMWRTVREMNSREMKRSLGFMITFLKNLSKSINQ